MSTARIDFTIWPEKGWVHAHTHTDVLGDTPPVQMVLPPHLAATIADLFGVTLPRPIRVVGSEDGACDEVQC